MNGDNIPKGHDDPAHDETKYEPNLSEYKKLIWSFVVANQEEFLNFIGEDLLWQFIGQNVARVIGHIEDEVGECNEKMIREWIECDVLEKTDGLKYYIQYTDEDRMRFDTKDQAEQWGVKNVENFNIDMIQKYHTA